MPNGYTAPIYENEEGFTFADFALRCARQIGYLISMRDEPLSTEIPETFEPDTSYYEARLAMAKATLAAVEGMDDLSAKMAADKEYDETLAAYRRIEEEKAALRDRYLRMQKEVEAWEPPTEDHVVLKNVMLENLAGSLEHDTGYDHGKPEDRVERLDGQEWRERQIKKLTAQITSDLEKIEAEIKKAIKRTEWMQQLRESLRAERPRVTVDPEVEARLREMER